MGAVFDHKAWRHAGNTYGSLSVGDITQLNVNGVAKNFIVVHQGNPDSSLYDSSCDGTWLLMEDIYEKDTWNDDYNIYEGSYVKLDCTAFENKLDSAVQSAIKSVKIPYVNGTGSGGSVASGANGLNCKIFLLSGYEVGFTTSDNQNFPVDGAKLDYFDSGTGETACAKRIAKINGSNCTWWLRSPYKKNAVNGWQIRDTGGFLTTRITSKSGVRPCFIMPSNQKIFS